MQATVTTFSWVVLFRRMDGNGLRQFEKVGPTFSNCIVCNRGVWGILALWLSERCPVTYRDLLHQVDHIFFKGTERLLAILTHSVTGRTQKLLLKYICHIRPVANSISTTQFHLRKLSKW